MAAIALNITSFFWDNFLLPSKHLEAILAVRVNVHPVITKPSDI